MYLIKCFQFGFKSNQIENILKFSTEQTAKEAAMGYNDSTYSRSEQHILHRVNHWLHCRSLASLLHPSGWLLKWKCCSRCSAVMIYIQSMRLFTGIVWGQCGNKHVHVPTHKYSSSTTKSTLMEVIMRKVSLFRTLPALFMSNKVWINLSHSFNLCRQ